MLANEITPTLEPAAQEKKHYLKWSANDTEIEKLQRLCVAYQYSRAGGGGGQVRGRAQADGGRARAVSEKIVA